MMPRLSQQELTLGGSVPLPDEENEQADRDHGGTQQLSHGERSQDITELYVRLSEKLQGKTECPVQYDKERGEQPGPREPVFQEPENREEDDALQKELVELRRVAGKRLASRKYHRPGDIRHPSVEFSVYEVPKPPEAEPYRRGNYHEVRNLPEIHPVFAAKKNTRQYAPDKAAVKRHAAVPDCEYFKWVTKVRRQVIKEHIP